MTKKKSCPGTLKVKIFTTPLDSYKQRITKRFPHVWGELKCKIKKILKHLNWWWENKNVSN